MKREIIICLFVFLLKSFAKCETLYELYTNGGINSGLRADSDVFHLNGKPITLFSGSFHYFRVHPKRWRPILMKMKAAGLNTVDFYSPWNLHEEVPGQFDFNSEFLNLTDFIVAIKEADLFATYRPGPFICAEWDFGGLPAWLLRDPKMKIRSNYKPYIDAVDNYWKHLFAIVRQFQFQNGGPIIAVQMENELGSYGNTKTKPSDALYMRILGDIAQKYGINELLFTSDGPRRHGSIDGYFQTVNFKRNALKNLQDHKALHPNQPLYVAEYWTGWFDNWGGMHNTQNETYFEQQFREIVFQMNSSINFYMFIGGTNFGFMSGNVGRPDHGAISASVVTSYDYDAPLSESGNYTAKYWLTTRLIEEFVQQRNISQSERPKPPPTDKAFAYGTIEIQDQLALAKVLTRLQAYRSQYPVSMENINIGPNYGQNFGFTLYRTYINQSKDINFTRGRVNDRAALMIDNKQFAFIFSSNSSFTQKIPNNIFGNKDSKNYTLDILVENMGRVDYGYTLNDMNIQRKGLNEKIVIDNKIQNNWQMFVLDFKKPFIESLSDENWTSLVDYIGPTFYRTKLAIDGEPQDTYLKMTNWTTSVVFVNGFNIGRYWNVGPTRTLYVAAPLLKTGLNEIIIFETQMNSGHIEFIDYPILG